MNVRSVGSVGNIEYNPTDSAFIQRALNFRALGQAVGAGDLSTARLAYSAFKEMTPALSAGQANGDPFCTDFNALGEALNAGDTQAARDAFRKLQKDIQRTGQDSHRQQYSDGGSNSGRRIPIIN